MTASIRMLQDLQGLLDSNAQLIEVSKPELLAKLVSIELLAFPEDRVITAFRDIRCQKLG